MALSPEIVNGLLEGLQAAQQGLRSLLSWLGLAPEVYGQPAWPFAHRLSAEMLLVDAGHARRVLTALGASVFAAGLVLWSFFWRRARERLWLLAVAVLVLTPWPDANLLLTAAVPTSLHQSPSGFSAQGIVRGQAVYQQQCIRCHGTDGRGEGPDAASLPMWPPSLNGALLWKRLDGELFWRVREGMQGRGGVPTMPGFGHVLNDQEVWDVLDYLQAHAAGQMLRESGAWERPIRLPALAVRCRRGLSGEHSTHDLLGQRVRVVLPSAAGLPEQDPRLVDLVATARPQDAGDDPECLTDGPASMAALALVLGVPQTELPGYQMIVDRAGWLRARGLPGAPAWSEDDLVCRSGVTGPAVTKTNATPGEGLDALVRRMDAEPVRLLRGGFPH
ncbi:c-type cytochrome [Variovorax sp. HJSM1_2]|uniref:c-type cytochrome n=1 Tax=Variovorax sp. HJSM1_2 TaxID=3366263 RepID=UPI003BE474CA